MCSRWLVVAALSFMFGVGCGGGSSGGAVCTAGMQSTPNAPGDPCQQLPGNPCMAAGQAYVATCNADGSWGSCICPAVGMCGNNIREGSEQCDGADLGGATCGSLTSGGGGTLFCTTGTCTYDMSMCTTGGGGMGGAGSGG